ncbi:MAG: hypothetical protein ACI9QC_000099 [Oceanicoccus sp.]|jgi:hypothetical protein
MPKKISINDSYQKGHYFLVEAIGKNFQTDFKPELTPKEMLELGVFNGQYIADEPEEFPQSWFTNVNKSNCFGIEASMPLEHWQKKGWIHPQDPRGWFQWYCRYYLGRRSDDDQRQIKRWKAMTRHIGQIKKNCEPRNTYCRPKQRQALLHWAYDSRKI